ncbi:ABC transporter permease [Heliobacterium mobile]|nr:ABC transporter permease [Heliobacterium mobile]
MQLILLMATKEFIHILRDKRTIFLLFLAPLVTFVLFSYMYTGQRVTDMTLVIVDQDHSTLSRELINEFGQSELFSYQGLVDSYEEVEKRLQEGKTDVAVIIPEHFNRDVKDGRPTTVMTLVDGTNMLISNGATKGATQVLQTLSAGVSLRLMEANGIVPAKAMSILQPINSTIRIGYNPTYNYRIFLLFGLVATVLQQVLLTTMAGSFCREKDKGTNMILVASRISANQVVLGKIIPYFTISLLNIFLLILLANVTAGIGVRGNGFDLFCVALGFVLALVGMASLISVLVPDELRANQILLLIAAPSFLISGFTWPLSKMPALIVGLSNCLPLTQFLSAFRIVGMKGASLTAVPKEMAALYGIGLIGIMLSIEVWKTQREKGKLLKLN